MGHEKTRVTDGTGTGSIEKSTKSTKINRNIDHEYTKIKQNIMD